MEDSQEGAAVGSSGGVSQLGGEKPPQPGRHYIFGHSDYMASVERQE